VERYTYRQYKAGSINPLHRAGKGAGNQCINQHQKKFNGDRMAMEIMLNYVRQALKTQTKNTECDKSTWCD